MYSVGGLMAVNSTIAYNRAPNGGGLYESSNAVQFRNTTIARNIADSSGGGIWNGFHRDVSLNNTLLAENVAGTGQDCYGNLISGGYNLVGDTSSCDISWASGDYINIDTRILMLYGNPSTFSLQPDSPAIDGGNPAGCINHLGGPLAYDEEGTARPLDGNIDGELVCDIGSFEYDPLHPPQYIYLPFIRR